MSYKNDIIVEFYYNTCQLVKATKHYNQILRP